MIKSRSFIQGLVASLIICTMLAITAGPVLAGKEKTDAPDIRGPILPMPRSWKGQ